MNDDDASTNYEDKSSLATKLTKTCHNLLTCSLSLLMVLMKMKMMITYPCLQMIRDKKEKEAKKIKV